MTSHEPNLPFSFQRAAPACFMVCGLILSMICCTWANASESKARIVRASERAAPIAGQQQRRHGYNSLDDHLPDECFQKPPYRLDD
jgi:hypothetical protein